MKAALSEPLAVVLTGQELAALRLLREAFGVDVTRTYRFWEAVVARITTGEQTSHKCPWDVELDYFGERIRIEVKYSQEFGCRIAGVSRRVFKFASPKGAGKEKPSDVTVLVGIDPADDVHAWVIPSSDIPQSKSITLTSPRTRSGRSRFTAESARVPLTQLLPEVLHAWRCHEASENESCGCVARAVQGDLFVDLFDDVDDDERGRSC